MTSWITSFFSPTQNSHLLTTNDHSSTSLHGVEKELAPRPRQEEKKSAQLAEEEREASRPPYIYVSGQQSSKKKFSTNFSHSPCLPVALVARPAIFSCTQSTPSKRDSKAIRASLRNTHHYHPHMRKSSGKRAYAGDYTAELPRLFWDPFPAPSFSSVPTNTASEI